MFSIHSNNNKKKIIKKDDFFLSGITVGHMVLL